MRKATFNFLVFLVTLLLGGAGAAHAQPVTQEDKGQEQSQTAIPPRCVYQPSKMAAAMEETPGSVPIVHGVNLSRWWEDVQDRAVSPDELRQIRDSGFDFVRLPVSPMWAETNDVDELKKRMMALRCDIISILNADLRVVLDLHAPENFQQILDHNPNEAVPRIEDVWRKLQPVVDGLPTRQVFLGLFNEPLVETDLWWRVQERIVEDLRHFYPDNTFIVASGPFDGWWSLITKKPYNDLNVIYDFHFYEPTIFTHHGADWLPDQKNKTPSPIAYPVTKTFHFDLSDPDIEKYVKEEWGYSAISRIIDEVVSWKDYYRVKVVCLEFGVYRPYVDDESRYNWLHDVSDALDNAHIPWALWEYRGPFGLIDRSDGTMDKGMLRALGLKQVQMP